LPIRYVICIFINKQVDIYSLAKLQLSRNNWADFKKAIGDNASKQLLK